MTNRSTPINLRRRIGLPAIGVAKIALSFAELAERDLDASLLLFEREKYPHAVFFFQQSVEKATKAVGLLLGLTTVSDLKKDVGHKSVLAILLRLPERVEELKSRLDAMSKSPDTRRAKKELDRLGLGELMPDPEELSRGLVDKNTASLQAKLVKAFRPEEMWTTTLELDDYNPRGAAFLKMLDDAEAQWKPLDDFATQFEKIAPYLGEPEIPRYFLNLRGKAFPEVMPLALISMWHARETRYPPVEETDYWDPNAYRATKGLVKLYPRLHRHAQRLCSAAVGGANAALKI